MAIDIDDRRKPVVDTLHDLMAVGEGTVFSGEIQGVGGIWLKLPYGAVSLSNPRLLHRASDGLSVKNLKRLKAKLTVENE